MSATNKIASRKYKGSRMLYPTIIDEERNLLRHLVVKTLRLPRGVMPVGEYEVVSINYLKSLDALEKEINKRIGKAEEEFAPLAITIQVGIGYLRLFTKGSILLSYLSDTLGVEMPLKVDSNGREFQNWSKFLSTPVEGVTPSIGDFLLEVLKSLEKDFTSWKVMVNIEDTPSVKQDWIKYTPIYKNKECTEKYTPEELKEVLMKK